MVGDSQGSMSFIVNVTSTGVSFSSLSGVPVIVTTYSPGSYVALSGVKIRTPSETVPSIIPSKVKSSHVMGVSWSAPSLTTAVQV